MVYISDMRQEMLFYLGVKALIQNAAGDVLVLRITKQDGSQYYDLPGGRINQNEDVETALRREMLEETGMSDLVVGEHIGMALTPVTIPISDDEQGGLILSVYACSASGQDRLQPEENMEILWCPPEEAIGYISGKLAALVPAIRKALV